MLDKRIENIPSLVTQVTGLKMNLQINYLNYINTFQKVLLIFLINTNMIICTLLVLQKTYCDIPCMNPALMAEIVLLKNQYKDKVYIKGTFGDEIYWHNGSSGLLCAMHEYGCKTLEEAQKVLLIITQIYL